MSNLNELSLSLFYDTDCINNNSAIGVLAHFNFLWYKKGTRGVNGQRGYPAAWRARKGRRRGRGRLEQYADNVGHSNAGTCISLLSVACNGNSETSKKSFAVPLRRLIDVAVSTSPYKVSRVGRALHCSFTTWNDGSAIAPKWGW